MSGLSFTLWTMILFNVAMLIVICWKDGEEE